MSDRITELLLAGLTPDEFLIFYAVGIVGIIVRYLYNMLDSILFDPTTPYRWNWLYALKGFIRLLISLIVMAFIVARFYEFSDHIVNITIEGRAGVKANITAGTAFTVGIGIDEIVKRLVSKTIKKAS